MRRISTEAWSLNGRTTRTGSGLLFSVGEGTGCSVALMAIKRVMVEFISLSGYLVIQTPLDNDRRAVETS